MKRIATGAGVLLAVLFACATASAQGTKTARGEVTAVAPGSLTVKVGDRDLTFKVDSSTRVTARGAGTATREAKAEGKAGAAFIDIVKTGQGVEVEYHENGLHATSIRVLPAVPPPAGPASARTTTANGVVTAVSATSLTIKGSGGESTFVIDSGTKVVGTGAGTKTKAAQAAGEKTTILDFVGKGDTVVVRFTDAAGAQKASEVRVTRKSS